MKRSTTVTVFKTLKEALDEAVLTYSRYTTPGYPKITRIDIDEYTDGWHLAVFDKEVNKE